MTELDKIRPSLEAEIEELRREEEEKRLTQVQKRAIQLAREILDQEQFQDLELLPGMRKPRSPIVHNGVKHPKGRNTAERSQELVEKGHTGGFHIAPMEIPFEDGPYKHSRFLPGVVQINELNADYIREKKGSVQQTLAYVTLMIGKEAISYGDKSGGTDYFLEKLLSYMFQVQLKASKDKLMGGKLGNTKQLKVRKIKSKRPKTANTSQMKLIMSDTEIPDEG